VSADLFSSDANAQSISGKSLQPIVLAAKLRGDVTLELGFSF